MISRLLIAAALLVVVGGVAWFLERRRPAPPPRDAYPVPRQLDRTEFRRPDAPWLVALFSSKTCGSCEALAQKVAVLDSPEVSACELDAVEAGAVHRRYGISGIPTIVVADAEGIVRAALVGAVTATDLWAAVAECRQPGASPEPDLGALS
jgi:Thioredoxin